MSEREFAKFRFFNGLQELSIARAMREMLVAVAGRDFPGLMTDRAFLLDFDVPKDSVEKVMQIYRLCYGNTQVRDKGRENSGHQNNRLEKGEKSRYTSSRIDIPIRKGQPETLGINHPLRKSLGAMGSIGRLIGVPGEGICPCQ